MLRHVVEVALCFGLSGLGYVWFCLLCMSLPMMHVIFIIHILNYIQA